MEWVTLTVIMMFILLAVISIFWMIAKLLQSRELERWVKAQILDVVATVLIVLVIGGVILLLFQGGRALAYLTEHPGVMSQIEYDSAIADSSYNPQSFAIETREEVRKDESMLMKYTYIVNLVVDLLISVDITVAGLKVPFWLLTPVSGFLHWAGNTLANLIFFQYIIIEIIKFVDMLASLLLPIGIVLRVFPLTRSTGAMFMSFSIGLALIFPISIVVLWEMTGGIGGDVTDIEKQNPEILLMAEVLADDCSVGIGDLTILNQYISHMSKEGKLMNLVNTIQQYISVLMIKAFLIPLVSITITYTFIRSFGMLLGADLSDISRGLVKLI